MLVYIWDIVNVTGRIQDYLHAVGDWKSDTKILANIPALANCLKSMMWNDFSLDKLIHKTDKKIRYIGRQA